MQRAAIQRKDYSTTFETHGEENRTPDAMRTVRKYNYVYLYFIRLNLLKLCKTAPLGQENLTKAAPSRKPPVVMRQLPSILVCRIPNSKLQLGHTYNPVLRGFIQASGHHLRGRV